MLISFSVSNYRSFYEEATLNMVASNKLTEHPDHRVPIGDTGQHVLRAALIYGANAAGKSNLIRAMEFAQQLIVNGHIRTGVEPFRFRPDAANEPSSFEFRFLVNGRVFVYGFDVNTRDPLANAVQSEWLAVLRGNDELDLFARDRQGTTATGSGLKKCFPDDSQSQSTLDSLAELQVRGDQLFLSRVLDLPTEIRGGTLNSVIGWLTESLIVLRPGQETGNIIDQLNRDEAFQRFCSQFLQKADTGIGKLEIRNLEIEAEQLRRLIPLIPGLRAAQLPKNLRVAGPFGDFDVCQPTSDRSTTILRRLLTMHDFEGGQSFELPIREESDGTQQLLQLMPVLYSLNTQSKVVVIDELDRSLHPLLCWEIVRFFSETCPGANKQLIVTTHESHLLNQELLRRDEYWFVEKDATQQSRLVPLSEFKIRNDLQLQKGYLVGRFGAIPIIGSMEALQELLECKASEAN